MASNIFPRSDEVLSVPRDTGKKAVPHFGLVKFALLDVLDELDRIEQESKDGERMYFSGEGDSNQTTFESMSNYLKVGVKSTSNQVGLTLLFFLRMIIDDRFDLAQLVVEDEEYPDEEIQAFAFSPDQLISIYQDHESMNLSNFSIDAIATSMLTTGPVAAKRDDIDLWDLSRIREAVKEKDFRTVEF